ncbi:MAG: type II toxin-antitoxin system HicA family toxin [Candidatus Micrarchaeia archaeon]
MSHLPHLSGQELIKHLAKFGFQVVRIKGSHACIKKLSVNPPIVAIVPLHDEIKVGTLKSILRQTKISEEDFMNIF